MQGVRLPTGIDVSKLGTASLVFGLILILVGLFMTFMIFIAWGGEMLLENSEVFTETDLGYLVIFAIIPVPMFVMGGLLLRKYDIDRKKK